MSQSGFNLILALLLMCHGPALMGAKKLLLAVGIDQYDDRYWGQLRFAEKDAEDMTKALALEFKDSTALTSKREPDQRVTRFKIRKAFAALAAANQAEDDLVVIYLSGHGTVGKAITGGKVSLEKYVVTTDTDSQDPQSTGIAHKELLEFFENLKSRRKVLILDTCYSGGGKSKLTREILKHLSQQKGDLVDDIRNSAIEGSLILSASAWSEEAIESPALQNSLYTYHLIQGFDKDLNQDGAVSMTEAHSHASRRVIEDSEGRQHPTARIEIVGGDPILVKGKAGSGRALLFAYDRLVQKLKVEVNGASLGDLSKGGAVVETGKHRLTIKDQADQIIYEKDIHVAAGQEYSLTHFLEYNPQYALTVGPSLLWLHDARLREKLGSKPLQGLNLRLKKEHFIGPYSLDVAGFTAADSRTIRSHGLLIQESLQWDELGLELGRFWTGSELRNRSIRRDSDFFVAASTGPHFVWIGRHVHDPSYVRPRQSIHALALAAAAELGWEKTDANMQISLRYEVEGAKVETRGDYPNFWLWSRLALNVGLVF